MDYPMARRLLYSVVEVSEGAVRFRAISSGELAAGGSCMRHGHDGSRAGILLTDEPNE